MDEDLQFNEQLRDKAQAENDALQERLSTERTALSRQLRAAYIMGGYEPIKLILSQDRAENVGRTLSYYDYFTHARANNFAQVVGMSQRFKKTIARINQAIAGIQKNSAGQLAAVQQMMDLKQKQQILVDQLADKIRGSEMQLRRLSIDEQQLQQAMASLKRYPIADNLQYVLPGLSQNWTAPRLAWPLTGALLAHYGAQKRTSSLLWQGVLIAANRGDSVRAAANGRVVYVGQMHRYGLLTIVEHSPATFTLYGHLQQAKVKLGQAIDKGDIIGSAGNSGGDDKTGLYFEVRKDSQAINPLSALEVITSK
ncbi:unnamed protein product [Rotaria magnacalcarata]|nr:unnamed protein product [Rotaria magnacalcarata]